MMRKLESISPNVSGVKNPPDNGGNVGWIPESGPSGGGNGNHSSILAWEKSHGREAWSGKRVGHSLATKQYAPSGLAGEGNLRRG